MTVQKIILPLLPLRDPNLVIFPGQFHEVDVGRNFSINAVSIAKTNDNKIIIAIQKDQNVDEPKAKDFYGICIEAEVGKIIPIDLNVKRVDIIGIRRASLKIVGSNEFDDSSYLYGEIEPNIEPTFDIDEYIKDSILQLREMINENFNIIKIKEDFIPTTSDELSWFVDSIASQLSSNNKLNSKQKLTLLRTRDSRKRLEDLLEIISKFAGQENVIINSKPPDSNNNYDYEVGITELVRLQKLIDTAKLPPDAMSVVNQEMYRLKSMTPQSSEYHVTLNYIESVASLPWGVTTIDSINIVEAQNCLDADHFGLTYVKERIIEFLSVRKLSPNKMGTILCFVGPPGVGKTSLGRSIAKAIGRKFIRISLGGLHDESEIRGHRRTYVGALPGKIIQNIRKVGSRNPVFMLDEIDKLSRDFRGDPASALLEVLDPEQNNSFTDNFIAIPFDLSDVMFIMTANDINSIPIALRDRMEIIDIPSYSPFDKLRIAQHHLIPKQKEYYGLNNHEISISTNAISRIIEEYTNEAGVRSLERQLGTIMRKIAVSIVSDKDPINVIKIDNIPNFLGSPKIFSEKILESSEVGLSVGLAWNNCGGSILFVETSLTTGDGKIILTGNLGKILQESARTAHTWIKSNATKLGVNMENLIKNNVHIHLPSGAIPKDGPSAGIAVTVSMLSSFINKPVRNDVAMTGEITLRGRILPIGGLKEKVMAAHRAGIKEIIYPAKNETDIEDIPIDVRDEIKFIPVHNLNEVLNKLFIYVENNKELVDSPCA